MIARPAPLKRACAARTTLVAAILIATALVMGQPARAQVTAADSAAVLLDAARDFEAEGRREVAEALYRLILERYGASTAASEARIAMASMPAIGQSQGSGSVELRIWMTLYGAWLGAAIPAALGADSPEPYGVGLLLGGPAGFLGGRELARRLDLTEGQARAITLGGTWGTWQGFGWREVLDIGVAQDCSFGYCYDLESGTEEAFGAMIVGGLTGIVVGALLSTRDITPGTASVVNFASLWGSWFGVAGGALFDLEDDDLLAATLVGGNVGLAASALLAPGWNVSRSRARLISIAGVLGGLGGLGVDLLTQPDDDKVALGIPLAGSILGLGIGIAATRGGGSTQEALGAGPDGALVGLQDGRLAFGTPTPSPTLVPAVRDGRVAWLPAVRLELVRARF